MKKYVVDASGEMKKYNGVFDSKGETLDKNIDIFSGNGSWKHWYGFKLFIDDSGVVIKGMEPFVGRAFKDLNKLGYVEGLSVHNSIRNVLQSTQKSVMFDNKQTFNDNMQRISEFIDMAIAKAKLRDNG
jgi:hypothetical protein